MAEPLNQQSLFVEQAEYLAGDEFERWSAEHPEEELILKKLTQAGAKLVTGPRGCGKTTLLLKAAHQIRTSTNPDALSVYVNFKSSLRLEPFYQKNANASFWFNQWLLLKIYSGLFEALDLVNGGHVPNVAVNRETAARLASQLEMGRTDLAVDETGLSVSTLEDDIARVLAAKNLRRCVLFLDDAAHAFSPEQQRDFFDFFRQVKSRLISPKAAIYPGVTTYSSSFHVGHDAEEINAWIRPDQSGYLDFMRSLLERRLPKELFAEVARDETLLNLMSFAAFGMPRALLNMVRSCFRGNTLKVDRANVLSAVKQSFSTTNGVYTSLAVKLPMYSTYIDAGTFAFDRMIGLIKDYNKSKDVGHQSVTIAIRKPIALELTRVLGFFQYAGLLLPKGEISRGEKGVFEQFVLHYAALIDRNALFGRKAVNTSDIVEALGRRKSNEFTRTTTSALLGSDDVASVLSLALPPCQVCKTKRVSEEARFCLKCGAQLKSVSTFEALVNQDIARLPLTTARVRSIKEKSNIRTIKDILMDLDNRELRSVERIGPYWAKRIVSLAEEYIA